MDACWMKAKKVDSELVVACPDAPKIHQLVEEALDEIALAVKIRKYPDMRFVVVGTGS